MDLIQKFEEYKVYVGETLSAWPLDLTKINCIAVFKALAELTKEKQQDTVDNQTQIILRDELQKRVTERYRAVEKDRNQEVNKYLSQRFRFEKDKEPDFIQFTLYNDSTLYSREYKPEGGTPREGYAIHDFDKKDQLIEFLIGLDLTLFFIPKEQLNVKGILNAYLQSFYPNTRNYSWYEKYKQFTTELREAKELPESLLTTLWCKQSSAVALIKQGVVPSHEFNQAKDDFLSLTQLAADRTNNKRYLQATAKLDSMLSNNRISRRYFAALHRVLIAFEAEKLTSPVSPSAMHELVTLFNRHFGTSIETVDRNWFDLSADLKITVGRFLADDTDTLKVNITLWRIYDNRELIAKLLGNIQQQTDQTDTKMGDKTMTLNIPLNQILYGPPGTGKTYNTVELAVDAADPGCIDVIGKSKDEIRKAYKIRYEELVKEQRIRFVTFHQSYGYEEFVEGLSAKTDGERLSYFVKDGIFKQICEHAKSGVGPKDNLLDRAINQFKEELELEGRIELETVRGKKFFVEFHENTTFRVFPIGTSKEDLGNGYPVSIEHIKAFYRSGDSTKVYNVSYVKGILRFIQQKYSVPEFDSVKPQKKLNFALVIDEINRGNISKIFGELITLIEPSKRLGRPESLKVSLPYSGDSFGVPDNLYIIGTMNTADRSLALMDTALRRRFDFIEMMPDYDALRDDKGNAYTVSGVDIVKLMGTLNERIAALYDREHMLGHAFLIPVVTAIKAGKNQQALTELAKCFQTKIIPLLAEYFFEDWRKIRLVLADNQKEQKNHAQLITSQEIKYTKLFGDNELASSYSDSEFSYEVEPYNSPVWLEPLTYIGMYAEVETNEKSN
jgi:5-methylcytosine-specific restriction protein B